MSIETLSNPVTSFLQNYPNKKTKSNYRLSITSYLLTIYQNEISDSTELDKTACKYLYEIKNGRSFHKDLMNYAAESMDKYSPTTLNLYTKSVCLWLEECGAIMTRRQRLRLLTTLPPPYPRESEIELKRKIFREMYIELPERTAVLLLVLAGSGMRLSEALLLEKTDIDFTDKRTAVHIRMETTKTKTSRTTYLTTEASSALIEYLNERKDDDLRVFPFSYDSAQYSFRTAARRLGYSSKIKSERTLHWHMTRKWFISRFSLAANKDIAEHLAGHMGYLSKSYRRYTKKQILKEFKKAESKISILRF